MRLNQCTVSHRWAVRISDLANFNHSHRTQGLALRSKALENDDTFLCSCGHALCGFEALVRPVPRQDETLPLLEALTSQLAARSTSSARRRTYTSCLFVRQAEEARWPSAHAALACTRRNGLC